MIPRNKKLKERSNELRNNATKQENHLWYDFLKNCRFNPQSASLTAPLQKEPLAIYPSLFSFPLLFLFLSPFSTIIIGIMFVVEHRKLGAVAQIQFFQDDAQVISNRSRTQI